jgi:hypothetical protein
VGVRVLLPVRNSRQKCEGCDLLDSLGKLVVGDSTAVPKKKLKNIDGKKWMETSKNGWKMF